MAFFSHRIGSLRAASSSLRHTATTTISRAYCATPRYQHDVLFHDLPNRCGIVELNRPKALNTVNAYCVHSLNLVLASWHKRKSLIILKGSTTAARGVFCAGGDVHYLTWLPPAQAFQFARYQFRVLHRIGTARVPQVALIDGITMGAGAGYSVLGRYRVGTERTVFAMPEVRIGLFPDAGASYFLPRLRGELGTYLALTGARLTGADVWRSGLATHFCAAERLGALERALCECRVADGDDDVETVLRAHCQRPPDETHDDDGRIALAALADRMDRCFAGDTVEGILANLEADGSEWAMATASTMRNVSPLSLKVTLRMLRESKGLQSLAECLRVEYRLFGRFTENSDFHEGVQALLVRKDNAQNWRFKRVEDVPGDVVEQFFAPFERAEDEFVDGV